MQAEEVNNERNLRDGVIACSRRECLYRDKLHGGSGGDFLAECVISIFSRPWVGINSETVNSSDFSNSVRRGGARNYACER